jgi:multicomponent Na+:H+ antiporter subunit D
MSKLLPLFIAGPLLGAVLIPLIARLNRRLPEWLALLITLCLLGAAGGLYFRGPAYLTYAVGGHLPPLGINLVLDGLSHLLLLTVSLVTSLVVIYSMTYLEQYTGKRWFYALYLMILTGMNGVLLAGDIFTLFVFLEIAALATYTLVAFGVEKKELEAALRYLMIGTVASILILFGIGLLYGLTGTLNFMDLSRSLPEGAPYAKILISVLFLVGFGMKAALVPFHAWLPDAHTSAPAPVSATLSGVLIKVLGVYALIRIFYNVLGLSPVISGILSFLGVLSILAGGLLALGQGDLKRLLAYSSISQVGYIILGVSLGSPLGLLGGLFHLFNHALFKSLLFLDAGAIEYSTGTRNLKELGGLKEKMPWTYVTTLTASLSISGLPPFNGFWSKLLIIFACIQLGRLWLAAAAILGSILTLAYFLKVQKYAFFEKLPDKLVDIREVPWSMRLPMVLLALLCLAIGLVFPLMVNVFINPAVAAVTAYLGGR